MIPRDLQDAVDVAYDRMIREGVEEREASFNLKEAVTRQAEKACDLQSYLNRIEAEKAGRR